MREQKLRRNGILIMSQLLLLLGSLGPLMLIAVLTGTLGFLSAMGVTIFGAAGIAKMLGESIPLSYAMIAALAVGCGMIRGLLRFLEQYVNHFIAFKLLAVLRDKIFTALRALCPAKLETKQKGAIISMITSDIETLEVFYAHTISPICIAILVSGAVFLFVGLVASWYLALAAAVGYLLIGVLLPILSSSRLRAPGVRYRRQFSAFNAYFLDSIKGIREILLYNAGENREREVNRRSDLLLEETEKMRYTTTRAGAATELTVSAVILAVLAVGIGLVLSGGLTVGRMILGVVAVFGSFGPVIAISALPGNLTQTFASGDRVLNLLEETPAVAPITDGKCFSFTNLSIKDLSFSYNGKDKILDHISMQLQKGEIVGIVGRSGCGKSTLLKLLLRFWEKESGDIAYNGVTIDEIDTASLLSNVTMVSQSTYLFDETIGENLRIAKPDASEEEIVRACKAASVHDFILTLPDGYHSRVGMLGDNLSAGERQRIGLARVFLRGSGLILLDEPTSNVDSINEGMILQSLKKQKQHCAIILVSHRESTMAIADRIYRIEEGKIYEQCRD